MYFRALLVCGNVTYHVYQLDSYRFLRAKSDFINLCEFHRFQTKSVWEMVFSSLSGRFISNGWDEQVIRFDMVQRSTLFWSDWITCFGYFPCSKKEHCDLNYKIHDSLKDSFNDQISQRFSKSQINRLIHLSVVSPSFCLSSVSNLPTLASNRHRTWLNTRTFLPS